MVRIYLITLILLFSLSSTAQTLTNSFVPGEVIIKYRESKPQGKGVLNKAEIRSKHSKIASQKSLSLRKSWEGVGTYHYKIPANKKVQDLVNELRNDPDVEFVEPNYYVSKTTSYAETERLSGQSLDDYVAQSFSDVGAFVGSYNQTGAPINMPEAWDELSGGGSVVTVAVIDTGIDIEHQLLSAAIWTNPGEVPGNGIDDDGNGFIDDVNGWDFVQNDNSPHLPAYNGPVSAANSCNDHGTHVAGIIRGATQDIIPTGGYTTLPINQTYIRIMPVKFLDCDGLGTTSAAISAIYYAVNNGAKILNNSWGGGSFSQSLHTAIAYAYDRGRLFVAAAGNSSTNIDSIPVYPASYPVPNVVSVGASTSSDYIASFSNFGNSVNIAAPGVAIISTVPDDLNFDGQDDTTSMSGTSMAAPMVSGIAAMMAYKKPTMSGYQLRNLLLSSFDVPYVDANSNGQYDVGETVKLSGKTWSSSRTNAQKSIVNAKAAAVESSQPSYDVSAFRGPASASSGGSTSGGGCGLVKKVYDDHNQKSNPNNPTNPLSVIVALILFAAPLALALAFRNTQKYQRKYDRYKLDSQVQISIGSKEYLGQVGTIGLGGLSFNSEAVLKLGHEINLQVAGPTGEQINVEGQIVWMSNNHSYGVQFKNLHEGVISKISTWAKSLRKA